MLLGTIKIKAAVYCCFISVLLCGTWMRPAMASEPATSSAASLKKMAPVERKQPQQARQGGHRHKTHEHAVTHKPVAKKTSHKLKKRHRRTRVWNLKNVELLTFIREVSKETGKNFIIDPQVGGKVTVIGAHPMADKETYHVFLSVLAVYGYAAVPTTSGAVKIVPVSKAQHLALPVTNATKPGKGDEMVARVIPLKHAPVQPLVPILRNVLPGTAHLASYAESNVLIVVGRANTVQRFVQIVRRVDRSSTNDIEVITLQHATASEVVNSLRLLLLDASRRLPSNQQVTLSADDRSNSVLLSGDKTRRLRLRALIAQIDTPVSGSGNTEVIYLKYQKSEDMVPVLASVAESYYRMKGKKPPVSGRHYSSAQKRNVPLPVNYGFGGTLDREREGGVVFGNGGFTPPQAPARHSVGQNGIQSEPNTNALVITAPAGLMQQIKAVIARLDIRRAQVLVSAIIAEINETDDENFGIEWQHTTNSSGGFGGFSVGTSSRLSQNTPPVGALPAVGGFNIGFIRSGSIRAVIHALAQTSDSNVLSTPSVIATDNSQAVIRVLQNRPFKDSDVSQLNSDKVTTLFKYKDIGLTLRLTPQITQGEAVQLHIYQEIGSFVSDPGTELPITDKRQISTNVLVNNGDILVLGGLINHRVIETDHKVPVLSSIPVLGNLFKAKTHKIERRNLVLFIRPTILREADESLRITGAKYSQMRDLQVLRQHGYRLDKRLLPALPVWQDKMHVAIPTPFG